MQTNLLQSNLQNWALQVEAWLKEEQGIMGGKTDANATVYLARTKGSIEEACQITG